MAAAVGIRRAAQCDRGHGLLKALNLIVRARHE